MPANDLELLELAAKAAGMPVNKRDGYVWCENVGPQKAWGLWLDCAAPRTDNPNPRCLPGRWNPLTDDGDGARLEAALGLDVGWQQFAGRAWVGVCVEGHRLVYATEAFADHNGDKQAARRRATVRCAAAMAAPTSAGG